jgi:hypothetical protein
VWSCVAVTRGGWGEVWGFDGPVAARHHPLIQEGDAIVTSADDTLECWNHLFLARMCTEVLGDRELETGIRERTDTPDERIRASRFAVASQEVWDALRDRAKAPPVDPAETLRIIGEDRRKYDIWRDREQTRRSSVTEAQTTTTTAAAAAAAPKEPKKIAGHAPTAKISFGADKDGKAYDTKDNNPKRAGSKSGDRFAKYKAGMTLEQAVAAGCTPADIKWDLDHKFITVA